MRFPLRVAITAAFTLAMTGTAFGQQPAVPTASCPAIPVDDGHSIQCDAFHSPNVEYLGTIAQDVGLTTGAKVIPGEGDVPDKLFVTSGKNITIYNIDDPANPVTMGTLNESVAWEGEEVPTNGKVLVTSTDYYSIGSPDCIAALKGTGCVQFWDVRDPANVKAIGSINTSNHTSECALDCQYTYGSAGTIVDARGVLDGVPPVAIGNWIDELKKQGVSESSCHHIREIRPGVMLTACKPFAVISINEEDGGTPAHPVVLATGAAPGNRFIHSARWPREGKDKFILTGGENNFTGVCSNNSSTFDVYNADPVLNGNSKDIGPPTDEVVPSNGTYTDGHAPAGELGCSTHWFQENPSFKNGGLVALSQYENGVRFLQITPAGKIVEQGYFITTASSSSSPKWAPDGKTVYSIDYHRGLDILRWTGDTYVPNGQGKVKHKKGKARGTKGAPVPAKALRASRLGQTAVAAQLRAAGWFPGFCQLTASRRI